MPSAWLGVAALETDGLFRAMYSNATSNNDLHPMPEIGGMRDLRMEHETWKTKEKFQGYGVKSECRLYL